MYKSLFTGDGHEITDPNWVIPQEGLSFFSDRILGPSSSHHGSFVNSACHYRTKKSIYPYRNFSCLFEQYSEYQLMKIVYKYIIIYKKQNPLGKGVSDIETCMDYFALPVRSCVLNFPA